MPFLCIFGFNNPEMLLIPLLVVGVASLMWLLWGQRHWKLLKAANQFPGPKALPLIGNAMMFMGSREEMVVVIKNLIAEYGEIVRFWLGTDLNIIISDPGELKNLLTNSNLSVKGPQYKYMRDVLGDGILSGSGPIWKKHRKIASPCYAKRSLEYYSQIFNEEVTLLMEEFHKIHPMQQFDIYINIIKYASYAVCQTLLGLTREQTLQLPYLQEIIDKSPLLYEIVYSRMTKWYLQIDPVFWFTENNRIQQDMLYKISLFGKEIQKHKNEYLKNLEEEDKLDHINEQGTALLSIVDRFLLSGELNQEQLEKEIFTVFTSSQETVAKPASFFLLMMAYHPDCQEKLYNEVRSVIGDSDRDVTEEDLKRMPYLDMAFKEVVRLFPIGSMLQRTVKEDIAMKKGFLPAGCSLTIPIYHLHRDPRFWENPDAFDPERFNPENMKRRDPNAYIPFSLGPMDCVGRHFAAKLVKTICSRVIREFELTSLNTYEDLPIVFNISTESSSGYFLKMKRRSN